MRNHASGLLRSQDYGFAVEAVRDGGCVVAGISDRGKATWELVTLRYDEFGAVLWTNRIEGVAPISGCTVGLELDSASNVYVTMPVLDGYSVSFLTVHYSAGGGELWRSTSAAQSGSEDSPQSITLDRRGGTFVAGTTTLPDGSRGIFVVKYDGSGDEEWATAVSRADLSDILVNDILSDQRGNAIVLAGAVDNDGLPAVYLVKFDPSGTQLWSSLESRPFGQSEWPAAMIADSLGNAYVACTTCDDSPPWALSLIKYDSAGGRLWRNGYVGAGSTENGAVALAFGRSGNVTVTGWTTTDETSHDIVTLSFSPEGRQRWFAAWGSSDLDADVPSALAIDRDGNVYVGGTTCTNGIRYLLIKYSFDGQEEWAAYCSEACARDYAAALAIGPEGTAILTGSSFRSGTSYDILTVELSAKGTPNWRARYDGPTSSQDLATGLVLDTENNIYVTGASMVELDPFGPLSDFTTVQYDPEGTQIWSASYDDTKGWNYRPGIALGRSGDVLLSGTGPVSGKSDDYVCIAYTGGGERKWVSSYDGPASSADIAKGFVIDSSGSVTVTGRSYGTGTLFDFATVRYDSAGHLVWSVRYDGRGAGSGSASSDRAAAIALDAAGAVYVTGSSDGGGNSSDFTTVKYDPLGSQQWVARYDGPAAGNDVAAAITVTPQGRIVVTGLSVGISSKGDIATVCYDADGRRLWTARYDGPDHQADAPEAVAARPDGSLVVTGSSEGSNGTHDHVTIAYDPDGNELWCTRYSSAGASDDHAFGLTLGADGRTYVTGCSNGDYVTLAYDTHGEELWSARYDAGGWSEDRPAAIAVDRDGNVVVAGTTESAGERVYTIIKYEQNPTTSVTMTHPVPLLFTLHQNYPNPFNPVTVIGFQLMEAADVTLTVYDMLGKEVAELVKDRRAPGQYEITFVAAELGSGVYLYRLQAGQLVQARKMVVVK